MGSDLALNILLKATDSGASGVVRGFASTLADIASGNVIGAIADVGKVVAGIGVAATKMAGGYQAAMKMVQAETDSSDKQMGQYDAGLKKLSMDAGVAPKELAQGLLPVISTGGQVAAHAMDVLKLSTEDAVIGMTSGKITAQALTTVLSAFSVKAQDFTRVNGEMVRTVVLGRMTMQDYSSAVAKSSSVAVQYKDSMEDMNAVFATLTSSGVKNATIASTDYNNLLKVLVGNVGSVADKAHSLNSSFDENAFKAMNVRDKVKYLNDMIIQHGHNISDVIGKQQNAAAAFTLLATHMGMYSDDLKQLSDQQKNAEATGKAWDTTQQGFNQTMSRLKATLDVIMINIGNRFLPLLTNLGNAIAPVLANFADWMMSGDGLSKSLGGVGDVLSGVWKNITSVFGQIDFGTILSNLKIEFQDLKPTIDEVSNIIGGVFADHMKTGTAMVKDLSQWFNTSLKPALKEAMPGFQSLANVMITDVVPGLVKLWAIGQSVVDKVMPPLVKIFEAAAPVVIKLAGAIDGGIAAALKFLMPYILQAAQALGDFAGDIATRIAPIVINFFKSVGIALDLFMKVWKVSWPILAPVLKGVWDIIVGIVKVAWALVSGIIKIGLDLLSGNWGQAWKDMKTMFSGIWDGIKQIAKGAWDILKGYFEDGIRALISTFRPMIQALTNIPGPIGEMAKKVLKSFDDMQKGIDDSTNKAKEQAAIHMMQMKEQSLKHIQEMHVKAASELEVQRQELIQKMKDTKDPVVKHALQMKLDTVTHMEEMHKKSAEQAGKMKDEVTAKAKGMQDDMVGHSIIPDMCNSIVSYFSNLPGQVSTAISSLAGNLGSFFSGLATSAVTWGTNIIQGLINGINNMAGNVSTAIGNITKTIGSFLPHSPAEQGELRHLNEYGPNLVNAFAQGIVNTIPTIANAADLMTQAVHKKVTKKKVTVKKKPTVKSTNTGVDHIAGTGTDYVNQFTKDIALHTGKSQQDAEKMMSNLLTTVQKYQKLLLDAEKSGNKKRIAQTKTDLTLLNQQLKLYENAIKQAGDKYDLNNLKNPITFKATTGILNAPGNSTTSTGSTSSGGGSNPTYAIYNYNTNLHIDKIEVPIGTTQQQVRTIVDMVEKELGKRQRMQGVIAQSSGVAA